MLLNYLKLSFRLLTRNPFFTFINVAGLSVGFAAFFILWQYSQHELRSDQQWKDWDRIVRCGLNTQWTDDGNHWEQAIMGVNRVPLARRIMSNYQDVEDMTFAIAPTFFNRFNAISSIGHGPDIFMKRVESESNQVGFLESKVMYGETNFFRFFSMPLLRGNPETILLDPNSVVLSQRAAEKYFGYADPLGELLILNDTIQLRVTGVFRNLPANTHFDFDVVMSSGRIQKAIDEFRLAGSNYFKLRTGTNLKALQNQINTDLKDVLSQETWRSNSPYLKAEIFMQPIKEIVFDHLRADEHTIKSKRVLTTLSAFCWVVLLMAWMNSINLTLSLNSKRGKEFAARKTSGARSMDFVKQFLTEAVLVHLLSVLMTFTLIQLVKAPINSILDLYIPEWSALSSQSILITTALLMCSILITGLYPTFATLKQSPKSLFGLSKMGNERNRVSYVLTTFQFTLAMGLIACVFTAYQQNIYILHKDIGMSTDQVLIIDAPINLDSTSSNKLIYFQREISGMKGVEGTTSSFSVGGNKFAHSIYLEKAVPGLRVEMDGGVDEHFIPFFGIKVLAGRNFSGDVPSNEGKVIVSKKTVERLGFKNIQEAVSARLNTRFGPGIEIIGVIEDYKMRPLLRRVMEDDGYQGTPGLALTFRNPRDYAVTKKIVFRVVAERLTETISAIEKSYSALFPGAIFNYTFLEDNLANQYAQYTIALRQLSTLAILAIGIACMGLLGMVTNKVLQKTKEIGIRKVWGAAIHQIGLLLLTSTARQTMIAIVIGLPVAFYITQKYLQEFSERIELQWWHFALPVVMLVVIMLCTVATVVWKAAKNNPVEALKYE